MKIFGKTLLGFVAFAPLGALVAADTATGPTHGQVEQTITMSLMSPYVESSTGKDDILKLEPIQGFRFDLYGSVIETESSGYGRDASYKIWQKLDKDGNRIKTAQSYRYIYPLAIKQDSGSSQYSYISAYYKSQTEVGCGFAYKGGGTTEIEVPQQLVIKDSIWTGSEVLTASDDNLKYSVGVYRKINRPCFRVQIPDNFKNIPFMVQLSDPNKAHSTDKTLQKGFILKPRYQYESGKKSRIAVLLGTPSCTAIQDKEDKYGLSSGQYKAPVCKGVSLAAGKPVLNSAKGNTPETYKGHLSDNFFSDSIAQSAFNSKIWAFQFTKGSGGSVPGPGVASDDLKHRSAVITLGQYIEQDHDQGKTYHTGSLGLIIPWNAAPGEYEGQANVQLKF